MVPNFEEIINKEFLEKNNNRVYEDGNRLRNIKKKSSSDNPLITIITVVKNNSKYLEETINSILNQKYKNIEYIIIDGLSTDGTLEIIKKYIKHIDYAISEEDKGNYDAINKGLSLSKGDLIGIVNGDDILLPDATSILIDYYKKFPKVDFFFGSVKKHWGTLTGFRPHVIKYSWFFYTSHSTGFFIKKNALQKNGKYSLKYKYSSDFDYFYRLIVHNKLNGIATKKEEVFGIFRPGGISSTLNKEEHFFEKKQIRVDNKQNKIFLFLLFSFQIFLNIFSKNRVKLKNSFNFFKKNFF